MDGHEVALGAARDSGAGVTWQLIRYDVDLEVCLHEEAEFTYDDHDAQTYCANCGFRAFAGAVPPILPPAYRACPPDPDILVGPWASALGTQCGTAHPAP